MPATINLSTISGSIERHDRYSTMAMQICGTSLGRDTVTVATVADVRTGVQAFGQRIRAAHPEASFMVSIPMRKGDRKPRGYDKAYLDNGFGQENFMHAVDLRTKPAPEPSDAGAAAPAPPAA